jgi:hypothetical protein
MDHRRPDNSGQPWRGSDLRSDPLGRKSSTPAEPSSRTAGEPATTGTPPDPDQGCEPRPGSLRAQPHRQTHAGRVIRCRSVSATAVCAGQAVRLLLTRPLGAECRQCVRAALVHTTNDRICPVGEPSRALQATHRCRVYPRCRRRARHEAAGHADRPACTAQARSVLGEGHQPGRRATRRPGHRPAPGPADHPRLRNQGNGRKPRRPPHPSAWDAGR